MSGAFVMFLVAFLFWLSSFSYSRRTVHVSPAEKKHRCTTPHFVGHAVGDRSIYAST
jgi:hypothetical protein